MSLIKSLAQIMDQSTAEYEQTKAAAVTEMKLPDRFGGSDNILAFCDNASFMKYLTDERNLRGKVKLVYIDPPFFSKANYKATISISDDGKKVKHIAYEDIWEKGMEEYLRMIATRLLFIRDLLAEDGSIWVHLDWHSSHYVKILMDEIFGDQNFINEIIWQYKSGGSTKKHFARKHDNILVYGKSSKYYLRLPREKSYNRGLKSYKFKGVEEFCDDVGWYTLVNMKDVWNIDMVGRTSKERTGYATQKPEALIARIIEAASEEGDIVCDFFCGSGTSAAAAQKLGRKWICCDKSPVALATSIKRFSEEKMEFSLLQDEKCEGQIQIREGEHKSIRPPSDPEKKLYIIEI